MGFRRVCNFYIYTYCTIDAWRDLPTIIHDIVQGDLLYMVAPPSYVQRPTYYKHSAILIQRTADKSYALNSFTFLTYFRCFFGNELTCQSDRQKTERR